MNGIDRIQKAFESPEKIKLMTHIVAGFPDLSSSEEIVMRMAENGADFIEIQIPFSDPTADGPSILNANMRALAQGVTSRDAIDMAERCAKSSGIPIFLMSYLNPVFAYGIEAFIDTAADKGIAGVIIPDCPIDDDLGLVNLCNGAEIAFVPLIAPGTSEERMKMLSAKTLSPFVYAVMRLGITGRKTDISGEARIYLESIKKITGKFCAAGFGIREKEQITSLIGTADCAIVGSAVTDTVRNAVEKGLSPSAEAGRFVKELTD